MPIKQYPIHLAPEQRVTLEQLARSNKRSKRQRTRAHILLLADANSCAGVKDPQICQQIGVSASTVVRVRQRFVQGGLDAALHHKPQQKRKPRKLDGAGEAHLIALVCGAPPEGHKRWSLHLLQDKLIEMQVVDTISHEAVRTTLKKMSLNLG